jgi:hypothetical protein
MRHPEYPTSIRLSVPDKKRLRKLASKWQLSLAGLIQMIIKQWLEVQEEKKVVGPTIVETDIKPQAMLPALTRQEAHTSSEPARSEEGKPFIGAME